MDTVSLLDRLEQLNEIGVALSREEDLPSLLERILRSAIDLTHADAGTIYVTNARRELAFRIMVNHTLGIALGGGKGGVIDLPDIALYDAAGQPNDHMVAAYAATRQATVNIADVETAAGFDFSGTREFNARTGYRSKSFLTVPLIDHNRETIGVLQLINALDPETGAIRAFPEEDQRLAESLASQAAIAYTKRLLIDQLARLFESLVTLIDNAIDEKSPYTSNHCNRVPDLTMLIAEAAHRSERGPLASFTMTDADRYELRIAGLMHDCGKITTPVHVMDKATKLQTLFDRVRLVDDRFEVLRRDAAIIRLEAMLAGSSERGDIETEYQARLRQLADDQTFLRRCNVGGEAMSETDQARVSRIAAYRWTDADGVERPFLDADEETCLCIARGTLTEGEREVINHHIVTTIEMLEALPWPKHLRRVPEYAGGHHERMDGKGYPKGLTGDQMSVQARIMAIADIFEALTSIDRPYKSAKKLSETLAIMDRMAAEGHIDPDIYAVFVEEQVYLAYAREFLDPAQIDFPREGERVAAATLQSPDSHRTPSS
ncbi:MAG: HD domain-containing phosphohydrolase [Pseudomonadota bacterium]|nr:HD domain-containing phosphohydrolase [Pseudomonadota bacterium]MDP1905276.1 HD domain-containing phosphohydrolase [Pseudomonadota bacterium]MDP2352562.1 HD domain-containing phosphohydrolase [Pseudomonadota bacterium]